MLTQQAIDQLGEQTDDYEFRAIVDDSPSVQAGHERTGYQFSAEQVARLARTARSLRTSGAVTIAFCALGALAAALEFARVPGARVVASIGVTMFALQIVASATLVRAASTLRAAAADARGNGIKALMAAIESLRWSFAVTRRTLAMLIVMGAVASAVRLAQTSV